MTRAMLLPLAALAVATVASHQALAQAPPPQACAAPGIRRACMPCKGGGGTGDCSVIKKVQFDVEQQNGTELAAQCCAEAQRVPTCSVWTMNMRNGECILKSQGIDDPRWNTTDGACYSGRGPAPLPPPGPAPGPAPPGPSAPCPPRPPAPPPASPSRNLLYIVVDDLRNELGYTNGRKGLVTPNIDALAKKGMVFSRAYIQQGVCSPSRNSFLSGRRPDTTRIWNFQNSFRTFLGDCVSSWPGAFKNAGFISTGMGKVYHPGHPAKDDGALSWSLDWAPYYHPSNFSNKISDAPDSTFQDGMITDTAVERLQKLGAARRHMRTQQGQAEAEAAAAGEQAAPAAAAAPFFMGVGLHKPHIPWIMPQRFLDQQIPLEQMDIAKRDVPPENYCNASLYICDNVYSGLPWEPANTTQQQDNRRKYRAAVSFTDFNVGRLLSTVSKEGLSENTAVIFNGDHGWQ
jgi:hypothetical protein